MKFPCTTENNPQCARALPFTSQDKLFLTAIITAAFALRFFRLDAPSMWWDEILVPMTARYPLEYIFEWARNLEVNSPYYIILVKLNLLLGDCDFCLRVLSAAAGVGAVFALAQVGRVLVDRDTGLFAALLLSAWPLHILLSRQLRPYALFSIVLVLSMWRLWALCCGERNKVANTAALAATYAALFALHYMAAPVILAHGVCVAVTVLLVKKNGYARLADFFIAAAAGFAPVAPFFIGTFLQRKDMLLSAESYGSVALRVLSAVYPLSSASVTGVPLDYILPGSPMAYWGGGLFLAAISLCCFFAYRRSPFAGVLAASSVFVPLLFFVAGRQEIWRPRHLSFLIPPLALAIAAAASPCLLSWRPASIRCLAYLVAALAVYIPCLTVFPGQLYLAESYPDVYKSQARQLAAELRPGQPVFAAAFGDSNAIVWYLRQFMACDPLQYQSVDPASPKVTVQLVVPEHFGQGGYQKELLENLGPASKVTPISKGAVYSYAWDREPAAFVAPGRMVVFSAKPWIFYRGVSRLRDVTVDWQGDPSVRPTLNGAACSFSKDYRLGERLENALVEGEFKVHSSGVGNSITGTVSLDGEPPHEVMEVEDAAGAVVRRFKIVRAAPVASLAFQTDMVCGWRMPSYAGSNLDTVGFNELSFTVTPLDQVRWGSLTLMETFQGLDPVENAPEGDFRWGSGPETSCSFDADENDRITVEYSFSNVLPGQNVTVWFNGRVVSALSGLPGQKWLRETTSGTLGLLARKGANTLVFKYGMYNGLNAQSSFAPKDTRRLAVAFTMLKVEKDVTPQRERIFR